MVQGIVLTSDGDWSRYGDQIVNDIHLGKIHHIIVISIDDYAKVGGKELLPRCIAFELRIFNDSIGIHFHFFIFNFLGMVAPQLEKTDLQGAMQ